MCSPQGCRTTNDCANVFRIADCTLISDGCISRQVGHVGLVSFQSSQHNMQVECPQLSTHGSDMMSRHTAHVSDSTRLWPSAFDTLNKLGSGVGFVGARKNPSILIYGGFSIAPTSQ